MTRASIVKGVAVWLAVLGFCLPQPVLAAAPPAVQLPVVVDVALRDGGLLLGRVVDPEGTAVASTPVSLRYGNHQIGMSKTDSTGTFAFREVRGGVHQVVAAESFGTYRFWAPGTAPPASQQSALVVGRSDRVPGPVRPTVPQFFQRPWVVGSIAGALAATAVSVPVALANRPASP